MVERISYRQFFFITFMSQMTLIVASLLTLTAYDQTRQDAWISTLLTGVLGPLITWTIMSLAVRFPNETFVEYAPRLFGRVLGTVLSILLILFLLERAAFISRVFAGMLTLSIYTSTPNIVFLVLTTLIAAVGVRYGMEVIARMADIFAPAFIIITLAVVVSSVSLWDFNWVRPILSRGLQPVILGAVTPIALFVEQLFLLMLAPLLEDVKKARTVATWASVAVVAVKLLLVLAVLFTFGPFEAPRLALPVYELSRIISIGALYERLDVIALLAWSLSLQMQLYVLAYAIAKGTGQLFGVKDFRMLAFPIAALGLCSAAIAFTDFSQYREMVHPSITGVYLLGLVFPVFLIVLVVSMVRKVPPRPGPVQEEDI